VFSLLSLLDSKLPILLPSFPVLHDFYMRFGARCVPPRDRRHESRCRRIDAPRSWHAGRRCDSASATEHAVYSQVGAAGGGVAGAAASSTPLKTELAGAPSCRARSRME
jgi:hypothetical protein